MKPEELFQYLSAAINEQQSAEDSISFLLNLLDTIYNPIFYKDLNGIYRYCNSAFSNYLGLTSEDIIGHTAHDFAPEELAELYEKADIVLIENNDKQIYETKVKYRDGSFHDVMFNKAIVKDSKGTAIGIVGVLVDMTKNKLNEKKLERFSKLKDAMLEVNNAIIGISDMNKLFNLILEKVLECISVTSIGTILRIDDTETLRVVAHKGYDSSVIENFCINLRDTFEWKMTNGTFKNSIIINDVQSMFDQKLVLPQSQSGSIINSVISSPIIIDNKLYGFINLDSEQIAAFDKTDLEIMDYMRHQIEIAISKHKLYEEIITLSQYDELTGLYNRRYFEEQIGRYMLKAEKFDKEFFMVLFDLNGLKHVNDKNGHIVGDRYIHKFAANLRKDFISADMAARIGGDEFIAVFSRISFDELLEKLESLSKYFNNNPLIHGKVRLVVSFSYGIACYPKNGATYKTLFKKADNEMYAYKRNFKAVKNP